MSNRKSPKKQPILRLKNICYSRNNYDILTNINLTVMPGEVHAIVGEHKAGKTTLVKIINGELTPRSGTIELTGHPYSKLSVKKVMKEKIGVVHQEARYIPNLTALENIVAGTYKNKILTHKFRLNAVRICKNILENELGISINLTVPMEKLTHREQQMVEVARIIYLDSNLIILDDVGGRLTPKEMRSILDYLKAAAAQGKGILFIDSDVDNVLEIADRVTTLHHGFIGGTEQAKDLDRLKLLNLTYHFASSRDSVSDDGDSPVLMKEYNDKLIEDLPAGVIILDRLGRIHLLNSIAEKNLKVSASEIKGLTLEEIFNVNPIQNSEELLQAVKERQTRQWESVELDNQTTVKIKITPFFDLEHHYKGTILMIEDISIDSTVKDYLARAEKISSIAELAAGVSHEINNPLGIINNYIQILKLKEFDEDSMDKLNRMETQLKRITDITSSLLSFSRQRQIAFLHFDIVQLLNEVVLLLNYKLNKKGITLTKSNFPKSFKIKGNENRLRQVFVNLVNNSIEALGENGKIELMFYQETRDQDRKYVQISIKDNGNGIPPEVQKRIFDPFYSTKMTKENAGLGLSICQHIVENHKGLLSFESRPGEMTVFSVLLPVE